VTGWHHNATLPRPIVRMRFDLFYGLAAPPQLGLTEAQAYAETLAQLELADRLGFAREVMPVLPQNSGSRTPDSAKPLMN